VTEPVEIALFTGDVERVRGFYELLLGAAPETQWPGGATFVAGPVTVLVHERSGGIADGPPNEDHVAFGVAELDAACNMLRAQGVELLVEPRDYAWGCSAYLRDPDGRLVELSQA
jgi:catechol 2,3-dioxygenase-like lactoylglutathione lyase family enzyme